MRTAKQSYQAKNIGKTKDMQSMRTKHMVWRFLVVVKTKSMRILHIVQRTFLMNAAETLAALQEAGIGLQVEDTSIVASPSSRLMDPLRAAIRANKPAIIAKLSGGPDCAVCGATADLWNLDTPGGPALAVWSEQAEALGWSSAGLFGLHTPPERPHWSYNRPSRRDCVGLCWL